MLHLYVIHIKKVLNKSLSLSLLKFILIKRGRSYFLMKIQYCHSYHSLLKVKQNSLFDLDVIGAYKDMKISWHYAYYKYRTQIFQTACNIFRLMSAEMTRYSVRCLFDKHQIKLRYLELFFVKYLIKKFDNTCNLL